MEEPAELRFGLRMTMEIFQNSEIRFTEASREPGDFIIMKLDQVFGHTHTTVWAKMLRVRVILKTIFATITTLVDDTEFIICQDPNEAKLTCKDILKGEVEVQAQGKVLTLRGETATFTLEVRSQNPQFVNILMKYSNGWIKFAVGMMCRL